MLKASWMSGVLINTIIPYINNCAPAIGIILELINYKIELIILTNALMISIMA
jgi:hypothetical protein